jgi:hypothetical protein
MYQRAIFYGDLGRIFTITHFHQHGIPEVSIPTFKTNTCSYGLGEKRRYDCPDAIAVLDEELMIFGCVIEYETELFSRDETLIN